MDTPSSPVAPVAAPAPVAPTLPQPTSGAPSIGATWRGAWQLFASRWTVILPVAIVATILVSLVGVFIVSMIFGGASILVLGLLFSAASGGWQTIVLMIAGLLLLAMLIQGFLISYSQGAMLTAVIDPTAGIGRSLGRGFKLLFPLFGLLVLQSLVTFGWTVVFLVPGLVLSGFLVFSMVVAVAEQQRGFAAMLRSYELVRGRWWGVVAHGIVLVIIFVVITMIIGPVGKTNEIVGLVLSLLFSFVVSQFANCYAVTLYRGLAQSAVTLSVEQRSKVRGILMAGIAILVLGLIALYVFVIPFALSRLGSGLGPRVDTAAPVAFPVSETSTSTVQ